MTAAGESVECIAKGASGWTRATSNLTSSPADRPSTASTAPGSTPSTASTRTLQAAAPTVGSRGGEPDDDLVVPAIVATELHGDDLVELPAPLVSMPLATSAEEWGPFQGVLAFGERAGASRLTDAEAADVRELRAGGLTIRELSEYFGLMRQQHQAHPGRSTTATPCPCPSCPTTTWSSSPWSISRRRRPRRSKRTGVRWGIE